MKINLKDDDIIEIVESNKSIIFDVKDIKNIYINIDKFIFFRRYSLNVITKNAVITTFYFNKRYKEDVKKGVYDVKNNIFHLTIPDKF